MNEDISPELIKPVHEVRSKPLFRQLVASMKEDGWQGRPLLVIERQEDFVAWTGSHRLAAAIKADLPSIPCYVLQESELPDWVDAERGHFDDTDRLKAIRATRDDEAIELMWLENRQ